LNEAELGVIRGRLDVIRQFTVLAVAPQKLACRYHELSADIAINQILKAAISLLRRVSRTSENQRRLAELEFAFADISAIPRAILRWDQVVLDRTNIPYHDLLRLAELLLGNRFQTTSAGREYGFSLLFDMNTLFEEFVGRTLQYAFRNTEWNITLQKPRKHALLEIGTDKQRFMTKPDIVIHGETRPVMVIDTKWKRLSRAIDDPKRGVSQSDVYQMMAYAHVYQVDKVLLMYPYHDELNAEEGILCDHEIMGTEAKLSIATLNLSNLDHISHRLRSMILNLLSRRVAALT
jgi:5-methylcytosine-specific restriction enzyme subunit McrC